jgi:hypothetical protein
MRLAAATVLMDRGFGKPKQPLAADSETDAIALHLLAATAVSREIVERLERHPVIEHAEPTKPTAGLDLLSMPTPLE